MIGSKTNGRINSNRDEEVNFWNEEVCSQNKWIQGSAICIQYQQLNMFGLYHSSPANPGLYIVNSKKEYWIAVANIMLWYWQSDQQQARLHHAVEAQNASCNITSADLGAARRGKRCLEGWCQCFLSLLVQISNIHPPKFSQTKARGNFAQLRCSECHRVKVWKIISNEVSETMYKTSKKQACKAR